MTFRNLTSDEVNFMIFRYLQESGFKHTAFSFANESGVQNCAFRGSEIPPGVLISFIQKGVQFLEIETRIRNKTDQVNYDTVFEMLLPEVPKEKLFARTIPDSIASSSTTSASLSGTTTATPNRSKSSAQIASSISSSSLSNAATTSSLTTTTTSTTSTPSSTTTGRRKNSNAEKASSGSARNGSGRPSKKSKQTPTPSAATTTAAATAASTRDSHVMQDEEDAVMTMASGGAGAGGTGVVQQGATPSSTEDHQQLPILIDDSQVTKLKGHTHEVFICAWNPVRSNVLASGSGDSTARIWELVKNEVGAQAAPDQPIVLHHGDPVLDTFNQATTKDVTTLDWSADGKKLATGSYDGKARIWTADGQLKAVLDQHKGPIFSLKWNKQGNYLLSGSVDNTAIVWDIETGSVKQQFAHHTAPTLDVDWRNNTSFATCSTDRMIYVYELGTKDPIRTFAGHEDEVNAIRWSPNGSLLASCSDDFTAKIWSFGSSSSSSQKCVFDLKEHTKEIYTIKWSPTGPGTDYPNRNMVLASASFDATIKLWDPTVGKCLHSLTKHTDPVYSVAFSPDGKYLASGSFDRFLHIWSVHDGKLVKTYRGTGSIFEVCWNSTGDKVAACFSNSLTEEFNVCVLDFHM
ncbi:hypothetical protein FDP41_010629 [Naegleria fowleri]|uniref:Uncharacterized protein n=1 Tax=Naegleria fowleri TaxID=5763 RepID=A0A6A5CAK7_NAEFO|nr:uncharacterized protein FDP41_010629 [Naegleria fowleri]KAF0983564.1 hypothetical protein FDP41_010629 [Naegleria fowleri]CAG4713694.1 unnamed protein product [Naegleria fowleri]